MAFSNPSREEIARLLRESKTIAVVGLSSKAERASYQVAKYLQTKGFGIIPVNPVEDEILGEKSYPTLKDMPEKIDIVDVFHRSEFVPPIAAGTLWLQGICIMRVAQGIL